MAERAGILVGARGRAGYRPLEEYRLARLFEEATDGERLVFVTGVDAGRLPVVRGHEFVDNQRQRLSLPLGNLAVLHCNGVLEDRLRDSLATRIKNIPVINRNISFDDCPSIAQAVATVQAAELTPHGSYESAYWCYVAGGTVQQVFASGPQGRLTPTSIFPEALMRTGKIVNELSGTMKVRPIALACMIELVRRRYEDGSRHIEFRKINPNPSRTVQGQFADAYMRAEVEALIALRTAA